MTRYRPPTRQDWINDGFSREEQIRRWCIAYNEDTVAVDHGGERETLTLPPGPPPFPKLADCFDAARQQYTWPDRQIGGIA